MGAGETMEFISGKERGQYYMGCLDDSIDENNPVRFVDAYVSQLDVSALGFQNRKNYFMSMPERTASRICSILWTTAILEPILISRVSVGWSR